LRPSYPTDILPASLLPLWHTRPASPVGPNPSGDMYDPFFDTPLPVDTHLASCTSLGASTVRRLESALTLHPTMHLSRALPQATHNGQLDIGANYSVTADQSLLTNYRPFPQSVPMDSIDASGTPPAVPGL
jgi:hypothetical protein